MIQELVEVFANSNELLPYNSNIVAIIRTISDVGLFEIIPLHSH